MRKYIVAGWVALWPALTLAAASNTPGSACTTADYKETSGLVDPIFCVKLLDRQKDGDGASGTVEFDISTSDFRMPDVLTFELGTSNTCSAGTIEITSSEVSGGQESDLNENNPTLDVAKAGTTRINVDVSTTPVGPIIHTQWSGLTGCGSGSTDGVNVLMIGYERER